MVNQEIKITYSEIKLDLNGLMSIYVTFSGL